MDQPDLRRQWTLLYAASFCFAFGFAVYNGVFQNYFNEVVKGGPSDLGNLEAMREIPGLLAAVMAGLLVALAESRIASIGLAICAIGIGFTGFATSFWPLVLISVFWSIGFHLYSTVEPALVLALTEVSHSGHALGRVRSISNIGTIGALGIGFGMAQFLPKLPYQVFYTIGGAAILASSIFAGLIRVPHGLGKRQPFIFRREYGLFYVLQFLEGCRRQIFSIFALFMLIKVYGTERQTILGLYFASAVLVAFTAPWFGRLVDLYGEKRTLNFYSASVIVIFALYAFIREPFWLYALFVLDSVLFSLSVGIKTYLRRIVRPGELSPCLAMGVTMNHVAAVTLPVLGGFLWVATGNYQVPLFVGVFLAIVAFFATGLVPDRDKFKQVQEETGTSLPS